MAIKKTIQLKNGLTANDAYIRVDTVNGCKTSITISVNSYLSEDAFRGTGAFVKPGLLNGVDALVPDPQPPLEQEMFTFTPDVAAGAGQFFGQAYAYILKLPKFSGGVMA